MSLLRDALHRVRQEGRAALIPYLTAGDPDLEATVEYACALADGGADVLELGVPFSDPLADGPVIQRAAERALAAGTRFEEVLEAARTIHERTSLPIVLMSYLNPILRYGWDRLAGEARELGIQGAILTDVPPEEADPFLAAAAEHDLGTVFLVAPTSGEERVKRAATVSTGFVYCVTRLGVTGHRDDLSDAFVPVLETVRRVSDIPVGLGFGISTADHARQAGARADAVIVGSALVSLAHEAGSRGDAVSALRERASELRRALEEARRT